MKPSSSLIPTLDLTAAVGSPLPSIRKLSAKHEPVTLTRACRALRVPAGDEVVLPDAADAAITQALGGNFTIQYEGNLYRIDGADADALGKEPMRFEFTASAGEHVEEEHVWQVLRSVFDPEIPVNLVDLGLIYRVSVRANRVEIEMTLTAPACGMGEVLRREVLHRLKQVPKLEQVEVELVFDPPWNRSMLSEAAKLELGLF